MQNKIYKYFTIEIIWIAGVIKRARTWRWTRARHQKREGDVAAAM